MRVLIADDSALLREGLGFIFTDAGHQVVASVGDGEALRQQALNLRPDLCVCDVRMPPSRTDEGMRAAVEIRREWADAALLMVSQYVELSYAEELLAGGQGSVGYLLKDRVTDVPRFIASAEQVASGGTVLDPLVVKQMMAKPHNPVDGLTPRERELLGHMAEGKSNTAIADDMCISIGAVEKHIQRIFMKLDLAHDESGNRRVQAVLTYLQMSSPH